MLHLSNLHSVASSPLWLVVWTCRAAGRRLLPDIQSVTANQWGTDRAAMELSWPPRLYLGEGLPQAPRRSQWDCSKRRFRFHYTVAFKNSTVIIWWLKEVMEQTGVWFSGWLFSPIDESASSCHGFIFLMDSFMRFFFTLSIVPKPEVCFTGRHLQKAEGKQECSTSSCLPTGLGV